MIGKLQDIWFQINNQYHSVKDMMMTPSNITGNYSTNITEVDVCFNHTEIEAPHSVQLIQTYGPYAVGIFCALFFVLGFIGNGTLLVMIAREKQLHQPQNIYLFSIALGDFLFVLVYTPFTIFLYFFQQWPFDEATCRFVMFLQTFSVALSVFTLTVLTCDKHMEVTRRDKRLEITRQHRHTLNNNSNFKVCKTIITALGVWMVAIGFGTLDLFAAKLQHTRGGNCSHTVTFCGDAWGHNYIQFRTILGFCMFCLIPSVLMLALYIHMSTIIPILPARWSLRSFRSSKSSRQSQNSNSSQHKPSYRYRQNGENNSERKPCYGYRRDSETNRETIRSYKRNVNISVSLTLLLFFCTVPSQIYSLLYVFYEGEFNSYFYVMKISVAVLTFINSCVNPVALCVVSRQYRRLYSKYLLWCCRIKN